MIVSCIIVTYNQMDYLFDCISSVLQQKYKKIELIIADDGSKDFDKLKVEQYIKKNKSKNLINYKIITRQNNVGTVRNLNNVLKISIGDIIIPLAGDDQFYDCFVIEKIVKRFKETDCEIMACSRMKYSNDMLNEIGLLPHPAFYSIIKNKMDTSFGQYKAMAKGIFYSFASGSSLYYKRSFIERVNYYDERYVLTEDEPFIARITREGTKIETAYDIVAVKYREGGISTKKRQNPTLVKDLFNIMKYEYLAYPEKFNFFELRIIKRRYESFCTIKRNYYLILKYFDVYIYNFIINFFINLLKLKYSFLEWSKK